MIGVALNLQSPHPLPTHPGFSFRVEPGSARISSTILFQHQGQRPGEPDWGPQLILFVKYFEYHPEWSGWGGYIAHSPVQPSDQSPDRTPALGKGPFLHNKALFRTSFKYITMMQLRPSVPLWGS